MTALLYDKLGPRGKRRVAIGTAVAAVALAVVTALALTKLAQNGQLSAELWQVLANPDLLGLLAAGLGATAQVAAVSLALSLGFGIVLAVLRLAPQAWVRAPIRAWVEIFRGLPLLLLIFAIFLGGPALGVDIPTFWALTLGISLYNSAVIAEITRAGILSLPRGQTEAAYAIGLRRAAAMRLIILPQAIKIMLPALISQLVVLIKETSLGFIIGYTELLRNGRIAVEYLGGKYAIPVYTGIALFYLAINLSLSTIARRLNHHRTKSEHSP